MNRFCRVWRIFVDEESEALDLRSRRASMMGRGPVPASSLETAPLHEVTSPAREKADGSTQDEFG